MHHNISIFRKNHFCLIAVADETVEEVFDELELVLEASGVVTAELEAFNVFPFLLTLLTSMLFLLLIIEFEPNPGPRLERLDSRGLSSPLLPFEVDPVGGEEGRVLLGVPPAPPAGVEEPVELNSWPLILSRL